MTPFVGLAIYTFAVYAACAHHSRLAHRRRVADWQTRARRIQHMRRTR